MHSMHSQEEHNKKYPLAVADKNNAVAVKTG
jgi:hypothetical protein